MVESTLMSNAIVIKYIAGVKPDGKDDMKSMKIGKIRTSMNDDDLFAVGVAIMSLMGSKAVDLGKSLEYSLAEN